MADFTNTGISPIQSTFTPPSPVTINTNAPTPSFDNSASLAGIIQAGAKVGSDIIGAITTSNNNQAVGNFSSEQLAIADAVDQGAISSQEGRTRMRANFQRAMASSPGLGEEFIEVHKNIVTTSGLGKVVAEGTQQEKNMQAVIQRAMSNGFINPDGSNEVQGLIDQQEYDIASNNLSLAQSKLTLSNSMLENKGKMTSNQKVELELQNAVDKKKSLNALTSLGVASTPMFINKLNELQSKVASGVISAEDAIVASRSELSAFSNIASSAGRSAGGTEIDSLMSPFKRMQEDFEALVSGKITKEVLDNRLSNEKKRMQLMVLSESPEMASIAAVSDLMRHGTTSLEAAGSTAVTNYLQGLEREPGDLNSDTANFMPKDPTSKEGAKASLGLVKNAITQMGTKQLNPEEEKSLNDTVNRNVSNILESVGTFGAGIDNPVQFNEVVDFLASPEFGKFSVKQGGIRADQAEAARSILQQQYHEKVIPLIKERFTEDTIFVGAGNQALGGVGSKRRMKPVGDVIDIAFSGNGIVFRARPGVENTTQGRYNVPSNVKKLNSEVASVINRMIRMDAHLSGTNDYESVWENRYRQQFFPDKVDAGDDELLQGILDRATGLGGQGAVEKPNEGASAVDSSNSNAENPARQESGEAIEEVFSELNDNEGSGDLLTGIETGDLGVTASIKEELEKKVGNSLSDSEAAVMYLKEGDDKFKSSMPNYDKAPTGLKAALLDVGFNLGFNSVTKFNGVKKAMEAGDWEEAARQTLDTANVDGKTVKGVALRRARAYNKVASVPITEVEQSEDGTITYRDEAGNVIFSYKTPKGKHEDSRAEVEKM